MDLKVFQACGVHGTSVATALTAQNTLGVRRVHRLPPRFVAAQIDAVVGDLPPAAAKTGMLDRAQVVEVVAERVRRRRISNLVIDPVILAKDGTPLLDRRGIEALKRALLPQALVVTPNVPEAEFLSGVPIHDRDSLREAARVLNSLGVASVLIKGGHLEGAPVDTLFWQGEYVEFTGERLGSPGQAPVHGTGCMFSAALAARVAQGDPLPEACRIARDLVRGAISQALSLGRGARLAPPWLGENTDAHPHPG